MAAVSDYEHAAQQAAEKRLEEYLYNEDGEFEPCACTTCVVREVLEAAWPHLRGLAMQELKGGLGPILRFIDEEHGIGEQRDE